MKTIKKRYFIVEYVVPETTEEEKEIIHQKVLDTRELEIMKENINFHGRLCSAGEFSFNMDVSGNLFRCITVKECYGNFFSSQFRMDKNPKPCPAKKCGCPYEGIRLIKDKKLSIITCNYKNWA